MAYPRIASLKTHEQFTQHLESIGVDLRVDRDVRGGPASPLGRSISGDDFTIGNRFCILPMEGWDGTNDGKPTVLTRRRWFNFGISGAKLIWGGEAVAVRQDGRANPNQLLLTRQNLSDIASLREHLIKSHEQRFGDTGDLVVGLQLTHSGRYARPNRKDTAEPRTAIRHPTLDRRLNITDDSRLLSDDDLSRLVDDFIAAGVLAERAGFDFVDIKHCHGYLGHELLSGIDRPGKYGGSFENRTRFLRDIVSGIRAAAGRLKFGVRLSIFDFLPFQPGADRIGVPATDADPRLAFGGDGTGVGIDLQQPGQFLRLLHELGIRLICTTAGSPYYNPHIQRPAFFPPSDGYLPPEDPLVGVARQIRATAELKSTNPEMIFVGSGYTYLQDWLPHVAQAAVERGMVDVVGLGRMVLSYPELPADVIAGRERQRKKVCRTFSDCTTAPRNGIVSGCYPLDPYYKSLPQRHELQAIKTAAGISDG